jgi:hypothetical protein
VTARLCDIAFADEEHFVELVDAILPLVSNVEGNSLILPDQRAGRGKTFKQFPETSLALLWAVFSGNPAKWPYRTIEALHSIAAAAPILLRDKRLIQLNRRWNSH